MTTATARLSDVFNLRSATWVFGGCGGTFYCAVPYLRVLLARYLPERVCCVDPDYLDHTNHTRQWPLESLKVPGDPKCLVASDALGALGGWDFRAVNGAITTNGIHMVSEQAIGPMLLVLNVDNNEARLAAREWCQIRAAYYPTAMVVSGCDGTKGQAYWGLWVPPPKTHDGCRCHGAIGVAVHDWLELHPDVEDQAVDQRTGACGGQTIFANAITGQMVGMAIEDLDRFLYDTSEDPQASEFYWAKDEKTGKLTARSTWVTPTGYVREGGAR